MSVTVNKYGSSIISMTMTDDGDEQKWDTLLFSDRLFDNRSQ